MEGREEVGWGVVWLGVGWVGGGGRSVLIVITLFSLMEKDEMHSSKWKSKIH